MRNVLTENDLTPPAERIEQVAKALGITMEAKFIPWSQSRNDREKNPSLNWLVTLKRNDRAFLTTDYMAGSGHCPAYKAKWHPTKKWEKNKAIAWECENGLPANVTSYGHVGRAMGAKPILPALCDVLYSLSLDSSVLDAGGFEGWASEYGYDTDSRKAEETYKACLNIALKMRAAIGGAGLEQLRNACQDY